MRTLILLSVLIITNSAFAYLPPEQESAKALPGETYEQSRTRQNVAIELTGSAYSYKQNFNMNMDVSVLPQWIDGAEKLEAGFKHVRDERMYTDNRHPQFLRRSSWLYPVDGCYIRASHMTRGFQRMGYVRPGKVFAFGTWATLRAKTPYAPNGKAWWGFHTAAAYRLGNRAMVLDPAINPNRVLPFEEWVGLIAPDPTKIQVAICDTNAYTPQQTCRGGSNGADYYAKSQQEDYLDDEWSNLVTLGFDPGKLLGDYPPWE